MTQLRNTKTFNVAGNQINPSTEEKQDDQKSVQDTQTDLLRDILTQLKLLVLHWQIASEENLTENDID